MRLALIFEAARPGTTGGHLARACQRLGVVHEVWPLSRAHEIPGGCDAYLRVDHGDDYDVPLPARLRPSLFYAIDTHLPRSWPKIRRLARHMDLILCAQADAVPRLPRSAWVPFGCDPAFHAAPPGQVRDLDIAFVGTEGGVPRKFIIQALRERYPNHLMGSMDFRRLGATYGRARIGFNYSIGHDVNMRIFEVLASGACLVTNALRGDPLARLGLRAAEHYAVYERPGDLFAVIDRLLASPEERERVAAAGRDEALARHTYDVRMQQIVDLVARRFGRGSASTEEPVRCESS